MEDFTSQIEILVRLGLMPIQDLPYLKKALGHVKQNMYLPVQERKVFYQFVDDFLKITLKNPALLRLIMNKTGQLKRAGVAFDESTKKRYVKGFPKGDKRIDTKKSSEGDIENAPPTASEELDMADVQKLVEHVRERNGKYVVTNQSGSKTLGTHATRGSALKQLRAIEAHKHMGESAELVEKRDRSERAGDREDKRMKEQQKAYTEKTHRDYANLKGLRCAGKTPHLDRDPACTTCGFHPKMWSAQGHDKLPSWKEEVVREHIPRKHGDGAKVRVPHKGRMVSGKVVRHDKGDPHGSPFYVVDVGEYESLKVPAHKVEHHMESTDGSKHKKCSYCRKDITGTAGYVRGFCSSECEEKASKKSSAKGADENEHRTTPNVKESLDLTEEINLRKTSINTLRALASAPISKKKAGGHITSHDKQLASAAKRELLRRKHIGESVDYNERFTTALAHFNVTDVTELDDNDTKDFLKYVDTFDEGVISANSQKLVVSDKTRQRGEEEILARKHMKDRLMASARAEYQAHLNSAKGPSAARALFRKDLKAKNESVNEDAGSTKDTSPNVVLTPAQVKTTKKNKKTQGHSGRKE